MHEDRGLIGLWLLCCLTFEVSWRQRRDARPRTAKMYAVLLAGAWWHAVGAQLDRVVRQRRAVLSTKRVPQVANPALLRRVQHFAGQLIARPAARRDRAHAGPLPAEKGILPFTARPLGRDVWRSTRLFTYAA